MLFCRAVFNILQDENEVEKHGRNSGKAPRENTSFFIFVIFFSSVTFPWELILIELNLLLKSTT